MDWVVDFAVQAAEKAAANAENADPGHEPAANGQAGTSGQEEKNQAEQPLFSLDAATATRAEEVGSSSPVEDFDSLVQQGRLDAAFNGLARIIDTLVARSLGDRLGQQPSSDICSWPEALRASNFLHGLKALNERCIDSCLIVM